MVQNNKNIIYYCPICGYHSKINTEEKLNNINKILAEFTPPAKTAIHQASSIIREALPSERNLDVQYKFIARIKGCSTESVVRQTNKFIKSNSAQKGKGFLYLAAMIEKFSKNRNKLQKMEQKRIGTSPPVIKLEED